MAITLHWCCKNENGLKLDAPNENLTQGYLTLAENALGTMNRERNYNRQFAISACYYSMYYALYSVLMKIGIKCEIHSCTLEFMKNLLKDAYTLEEIRAIKKAFDCRETAQYYVDRIVSKEDEIYIMAQAPLFITKSKEILNELNEKDIQQTREELQKIIDKN
ncbi:MAG: hypothetical protein AABW65_03655 [Nanoarchaeota archaeon]|mgnify:CR=1 FL=1